MPTPETIDRPPFPPLARDEYFWSGTDILPSWAGFRARQGMYASESGGGVPSDGTANVAVDAPADSGPGPEQVAAYAYLKANEAVVAAAAVRAVFERYPRERAKHGFDDIDEDDEDAVAEAGLMPEISDPNDLRPLLGLGTVHVLAVARDGVAYVGLEFGCTWDDEHGVGVMLHKDRVVKVGGADTSFLAWIAERDGGRPLDPSGPA
ncbi:MAG: hypothetical protein JWO31_4192 [Phycisphaerales bacterium]|nr:hypothetical protein [Phycisphaerales bacterium]